MFEIFESFSVSDLLDIVFMTIVIYSALVLFKRTRGGFAVLGLFIFGAAYLIARQLDLTLTTTVFQGFFAIILLAVVILFQEEIKQFLEQLASRSLIQGRRLRRQGGSERKQVEILVNSVRTLAREKRGAIIVVRGKDPIARHIRGGIDLNGELSEELIGSIFTPSSPSHDGALIVEDDRVTAFSCYLPLSRNLRKLQRAGTRHAAALGLAEFSDALCLVISEEQGTISVARNGDIRSVRDKEELKATINSFYTEIHPTSETKQWKSFFKKSYKEMVIALLATLILWFFFVHEAKVDIKTYVVPVEYETVPSHLVVQKIDPAEVQVTFSGPRRAFWFVHENRIKVNLKFFSGGTGMFSKTVTRSDVSSPEGLVLESIEPNQVTVHIGEKDLSSPSQESPRQ